MSSSVLAVECFDIQKKFGETLVLRGVNLTVPKGSFFMLVGPSGCGKTTLISVIAGILKSDSGKCIVLGQSDQMMDPDHFLDFRAKNIGFIFQSYHLLNSLTVLDNVLIPLLINHLPYDQAVQKATHRLQQVGLGARLDAFPSNLSGGEQQRVAVARGFIHSPNILICDEPTSALDHQTGIQIIEMIKTLNEQSGMTVIIVTHDSRILKYADQIAYMEDGMIQKIVTQKNNRSGDNQ